MQPQWHGGLSSARGDWRPVPRLADVRRLPPPSCGVHSPCAPDARCGCLPADLADTLADAAAVIIDYSQGGVYPAPAYQDQLAGAARAAGVLWIADEAVTGLGHQGRWLTLQRGESRPDMFIAPPLIVSDGELETILAALDRALAVGDKALLLACGGSALPGCRRLPGE